MEITLLEHVNLRTVNLAKLETWYAEVLNLRSGYRPPFESTGRWMYNGDIPIVHLIEVQEKGENQNPSNEHFALRAVGLPSFLEKLARMNIPYWHFRVPELGTVQINITDPDGNNMHIDFPSEEADTAGF